MQRIGAVMAGLSGSGLAILGLGVTVTGYQSRAVGASLIIGGAVIMLASVIVLSVMEWRRRRPMGKYVALEGAPRMRRPGTATAMQHRLTDAAQRAQFDLGAWIGSREIPTDGPVDTIWFIRPFQRIIRRSDTPVRVRLSGIWHRSHLTVHHFTDTGVVVEDDLEEPRQAEFYYYHQPGTPQPGSPNVW